jgi:hypothetical protein
MTTKTTYAEVWNTLSKIDCSGKIQKIGQGNRELSYLSWAWAWEIMMQNYPEVQFYFCEDTLHPDDSVTVSCRVSIGDLYREMWLPVMDNRNNAIKAPDARKISDSKMRCLVKNFALWGLGHFIYAGSDVPTVTEDEPVAKKTAKPKAVPKNDEDMVKNLSEKVKSGESPFPNDVENWDDTMADEVVDLMVKTVTGFAETVGDMKSFWGANMSLIQKLEKHFPEARAKLQQGFTGLRELIEKGEK